MEKEKNLIKNEGHIMAKIKSFIRIELDSGDKLEFSLSDAYEILDLLMMHLNDIEDHELVEEKNKSREILRWVR